MTDDLRKMWKKTGNRLVFTGTAEDFESWKWLWFDTVPKCRDFCCVHDSMTCGIHIACGDCSSYKTVSSGEITQQICDTVGCIDCKFVRGCKKVGK